MAEIATTLEEKKRQLWELKERRTKALCTKDNSNSTDVRIEQELEKIEEEIQALEKATSGTR